MNLSSRGERKRRGFKRFFNSFGYSIEGISYTIKNEQSIVVMLIATILAVSIGLWLKIKPIEWVFIFLTIGIVLAFELINTAIEATIDLISPDFHPLAKIAKDTGSAAVFITTIFAVIIGGVIFIPKIIILLKIG